MTLTAVGMSDPRWPSGARMSVMPGTRASAPIIPAAASMRFPMRQPTRIATSASGSESAGTSTRARDDHEERDAEIPPEKPRLDPAEDLEP